MSGIMFVDMGDRLIDGVHDLHRDDRVQIFCPPVFFRSGDDLFTDRPCPLVAPDLHIMSLQPLHDLWKGFRRDLTVDNQRLAGIAYSQSLGLCIFHDVCRHADICRCVHIDMTVACTRLDHRNCAVLHHIRDQSCAASGDEHINAAVHLHHLTGNLAARILHEQDYILAEFFLAQSGFDGAHDGLIGMDRIAASAEDRSIPGLKAESEGIRRHIGAGLINDPDHTQGDSLFPDPQSVGSRLHIQHFAHRVVQGCDLPESFRHISDPFLREGEPVDQRLLDSFLLRRFQVFCIFFQYHILLRGQFIRNCKQPSVLICRSHLSRLDGSFLRAICEHLHI